MFRLFLDTLYMFVILDRECLGGLNVGLWFERLVQKRFLALNKLVPASVPQCARALSERASAEPVRDCCIRGS